MTRHNVLGMWTLRLLDLCQETAIPGTDAMSPPRCTFLSRPASDGSHGFFQPCSTVQLTSKSHRLIAIAGYPEVGDRHMRSDGHFLQRIVIFRANYASELFGRAAAHISWTRESRPHVSRSVVRHSKSARQGNEVKGKNIEGILQR